MSQYLNRNILILHFTVLIWGFTGVLGQLISISAVYLVWYRVAIAALSLLVYFLISKKSVILPISKLIQFMTVGGIVGLHWILFFHSIKISTVSVTLVTLSSATLFTAVLEPLINGKKISILDIFVGLLIIVGISLIFTFEFQYFWGIIFGLSCAFCASLFGIFNSRMVKESSATIITFYEMVGAFLWISVYIILSGGFQKNEMLLSVSELLYLLILGIFCTAFAYVLGVSVMRELSAFTVALTVNLEPVYGIALAYFVFGERETMSTGFYLGSFIVLGTVFSYPYLQKYFGFKKIPV